MKNISFDLNDIFHAILTRRQSEGAMTQDQYLELIDEMLEEKRSQGLIDDDEDMKQAQEALESRWEEIAQGDAAVSQANVDREDDADEQR